MLARLTRRGALGAAGVALASCGGGDPAPSRSGPSRAGVGSLGSLLARERAVIAAYESAMAVLRGDALRVTRTIREQELEHARVLEELIRERGVRPPTGREPGGYARSFPRLETEQDALRFLEDLEQRQVRAYLTALAELPELDFRLRAAAIGADEAAQLAAVRVLAGKPASPHPFETGAL